MGDGSVGAFCDGFGEGGEDGRGFFYGCGSSESVFGLGVLFLLQSDKSEDFPSFLVAGFFGELVFYSGGEGVRGEILRFAFDALGEGLVGQMGRSDREIDCDGGDWGKDGDCEDCVGGGVCFFGVSEGEAERRGGDGGEDCEEKEEVHLGGYFH